MVTRKYTKDYRLENVLGSNGKQKTVAVYHGEYYSFVSPPEVIARMKRIYLGGGLLIAAVLVALLWQSLTVDNTMYVVLPLAVSCLSGFYLLAGVRRLWTANGPVTREHNDKTHDRLTAACAVQTGLTLFSLTGSIVYQFVARICSTGTILYSAALLVSTAVSLLLLLLHKNLLMQKTEQKPHS